MTNASNARRLLTAALCAALALSLSACGGKKELKLTIVEKYTRYGAQDVKAVEGLTEVETFLAKWFAEGNDLADVTTDLLNENLRVTATVDGSEAMGAYGGLPNVVGLDAGDSVLFSSSASSGRCLVVKASRAEKGIVFTHGALMDTACRASEPLTAITWLEPGDETYPKIETLKPATAAEIDAYVERHPEMQYLKAPAAQAPSTGTNP